MMIHMFKVLLNEEGRERENGDGRGLTERVRGTGG